jgi:hypothetical protein
LWMPDAGFEKVSVVEDMFGEWLFRRHHMPTRSGLSWMACGRCAPR